MQVAHPYTEALLFDKARIFFRDMHSRLSLGLLTGNVESLGARHLGHVL
jgi:hypothetical protein